MVNKFQLQDLNDPSRTIHTKLTRGCDVERALSFLGSKEYKRRLTIGEYFLHHTALFYQILVKTIGLFSITQFITKDWGFKGNAGFLYFEGCISG